jgi:hypothetical protein
MSVITTLDTLIERVLAEDARKYDLLADTRRMSVEMDDGETILAVDGESVETGSEAFFLTDHALGQMATDLGIPKRYFDRMKGEAFDLFRTNVHHWMYETPNRRMIRARRPSGDGYPTARAWLSDRFRRLDNVEIAAKLLPEFDRLSTEVAFHNASVTESRFYLRAVFPLLEAEVKVGEPVQWGVQISNSEIGAGQLSIDSFVNVLSCTNGMVVARVLGARHIGKRLDDLLSDEAREADDKAFWLAARDALRASISEAEFEKVIHTLRATTEGEEIKAPIAATERLVKEYSLSEAEHEAVLLKLTSGGDFTRWGALQAVTAAAQTVESFDRRVELETIGWDIASLSERAWEKLAVA